MKNLVPLFLSLILIPQPLHARTWTAASDGKKMEAEFVKSDGRTVTIRRAADNKVFTVPLTTFSEEDREFVAAKIEEMKAADAEKNAPELSLGDYEEMIKGEWVKGEHEGVNYQMYGPKRVKRSDSLPLVIYLHGSGERGEDNEQQIRVQGPKTLTADDNFRKRPCILIAPQAPTDGGWNGGTGDAVLDLIEDIVKNVSVVDSKRVYVTGYSMGAYGSFSLMSKEPDLFAGAVTIAGGANPGIAGDIKKIPIWNFHGDMDATVNVEQSRGIMEALEKARAPVKYTEMAGEGHGIPGKVYNDVEVHEWLFAQKQD
ncbi:MAG: hypothetical protein HKN23_01975 [Verrucomicrobiales bacterium]|nr:hypothetical protein [Verrucomicrobiales bacterium]